MIGHHFAISAFCQAPSAPGVSLSPGGICRPRFSSCLRTAGSFKASTVAALSLATIGAGVARERYLSVRASPLYQAHSGAAERAYSPQS